MKNIQSYLWWEDPADKKRQLAGVAYYNEETEDYTLKVNLFSNLKLYLKAIGTNGDKIIYRIERVLKKRGQNALRFHIGEGFSSSETNQSIYMNIGPLKNLVMDEKPIDV